MLLLFDSAADAVGYALAYQQALAMLQTPLKARAGLHLGPVTLRANNPTDIARGAKPLEVDGAAKATAARVMSVAMGGQTLLSASARHALPELGLRVQSHGHWRLKGLAEPVELFEVAGDDAPFTPPADTDKAYRVVWQGEMWLPAREIRHSLPAERDGFVGRAEALTDLERRMEAGARLVSVLGMGGSGKTRLSIRFGWTWLGDFPGGVWFCDLSQARSLGGIVQYVGWYHGYGNIVWCCRSWHAYDKPEAHLERDGFVGRSGHVWHSNCHAKARAHCLGYFLGRSSLRYANRHAEARDGGRSDHDRTSGASYACAAPVPHTNWCRHIRRRGCTRHANGNPGCRS